MADVAQLVEQLICNQPVVGSTPIISSISLIDRNENYGNHAMVAN